MSASRACAADKRGGVQDERIPGMIAEIGSRDDIIAPPMGGTDRRGRARRWPSGPGRCFDTTHISTLGTTASRRARRAHQNISTTVLRGDCRLHEAERSHPRPLTCSAWYGQPGRDHSRRVHGPAGPGSTRGVALRAVTSEKCTSLRVPTCSSRTGPPDSRNTTVATAPGIMAGSPWPGGDETAVWRRDIRGAICYGMTEPRRSRP